MTKDSSKKQSERDYDLTFTTHNGMFLISSESAMAQMEEEAEIEELLDRHDQRLAHYYRYYDPTPPDASLDERLRYAVVQGDLEEVKGLLEQGAALNTTDAEGKTPLILAVWSRDYEHFPEIIDLLLEQGAAINAQTIEGETALHWAVMAYNIDLIKRLLAAGADSTLTDARGETVADHARYLGWMNIADLLDRPTETLKNWSDAAFNLLEALERILKCYKPSHSEDEYFAINAARTAIAKAKGR